MVEYQVFLVKDNELIGTFKELPYVRYDSNNQSWVFTKNYLEVQALSIDGQIYNILGYPHFNDYPVVEIIETES